MTSIPKQLQNPDFRFVLIPRGEKIPSGKAALKWSTTGNYRYDDPRFIKHIEDGGNYGAVGGFGDLVILDSDTPELDKALSILPDTFTVRSGSWSEENPWKHHRYFIVKGFGKKIPLPKDGGKESWGDIQAQGAQCVAPGSIHPNGKPYTIEKDIPIAEISKEQLLDVIAPFRIQPDWTKSLEKKRKGFDTPDIPIGNIIDLSKFNKRGNEYQGEHPVHGSTGGSNFCVNIDKEVWHCFRCDSGGDALQFIGVKEGIRPCSDPTLYGEDFKTVLKIAEEKYINKLCKEQKIEEVSEECLAILKKPRLFTEITEVELGKKIVGELENRKAIFLIACGIFVEDNQIASYNLCVNSESGAGKDYVVKNVLSIFPKEKVETRTRISPTVFTYWHNSKDEPDWNWDGKVCYLGDVSNSVLNSDVFKVMVSEGSHSTIVIEHKAKDIDIQGKPVMIITTAGADPKNEMLRRFPILTLDESKEQTEAIMKRQAVEAAIGERPDSQYSDIVRKALSCLKPVKVKIPFSEIIVSKYPKNHVIMRTHFYRLLDFIKASAALHQYQRRTDLDNYLIAEPQDYDNAIVALKQITQNALMIPLTRKQTKFLDLCKELSKEMEWFPASELIARCKFLSQPTVYRYLDTLSEHFFEVSSRDDERSRKPIKIYSLNKITKIDIPTAEECGIFE